MTPPLEERVPPSYHRPSPPKGADAAPKGAYFPLQYYVGFISLLADNPKLFNIITYDNLHWDGDYDFRNNYPHEWVTWSKHLTKSADKDKIHVLIQHDVDSRPARTFQLLRQEERLGIPSNIMLFNRRIDRPLLKRQGTIQYTDYPIDIPYLQYLRTKGFVIGYHTNAVEQAAWSLDQALNTFRDDVAELSRHFDIRYFSPHGGIPGPAGLNNRDISVPPELFSSLRWVHNRFTPRFDANYSDGGINNPKRDIRERDLRSFVATWTPGHRYRVLVHPQYYDDEAQPAEHLQIAEWYTKLFEAVHQHNQTGWEHLPFGL
jgi:hypothetical protein